MLADDRTGALEVAGALADRLGPVPVLVSGGSSGSTLLATPVVVDLASRHVATDEAARRAAVWSRVPARYRLHKVDSTLRGRWADELLAVQRTTGARVLLVPALPALGRTCVGGLVHVDGRPLELDDPRHGPVAARPSGLLTEAGASAVAELADAAAMAAWADDAAAPVFAVCDASSDEDLTAIGAAWRRIAGAPGPGRSATSPAGVVLAGTSAGLAAAADGPAAGGHDLEPRRDGQGWGGGPLARPALVAVGSLHPVARGQLLALREAWLPGVVVVATAPVDGPVDAAAAERAAAALAEEVRALTAGGVATLVLVGGDTAAAVLGDAVHMAGGTVAPGIPWARRADGTGPLVVTKAGGFGSRDTLVDLLTGRRGNEAR